MWPKSSFVFIWGEGYEEIDEQVVIILDSFLFNRQEVLIPNKQEPLSKEVCSQSWHWLLLDSSNIQLHE